MRKAFLLLVLVSVSSMLFVSCSDEDNDYVHLWYSFSTLIKNNSSQGFYFDLDSGGKLIPTNNIDVTEFDDSSRVIVTYAIKSDNEQEDNRIIEGDIRVVQEMLTKGIIQLTEENVDSIGNDQIITNENSIWNSENHLNIVFWYYGYNQIHYINLAKPIGEQKDTLGNQILELRHNANNDFETYYYQSEVSFDMRSLQEPDMDSINFVLKAINGETEDFIYYSTFHFSQTEPDPTATSQTFKQPDNNLLIE